MNLGLPELVVVFVVTLLVFGPKRLPELAKGLGKGIRDFKKAVSGEDETTQSLSEKSQEEIAAPLSGKRQEVTIERPA